MFRSFAAIAFVTLTATAAQAQSIEDRVRHAVETACAVERPARALPMSHYEGIYNECVHRLTKQTMVRLQQARAQSAGTLASK
jgi:hypothetical protein